MSRAGPYTQDLYQHLPERLRFAGGVLVAAAVVLVLLQAPLSRLVTAAIDDLRRPSIAPATRDTFGLSWLVLLTGLALALRLAFVGQPIRYDEALTFNEFASRPLYYGLSFYPDPNNHLLNTFLVHLCTAALGGEPWVIRLPALVAGVLLIPASWMLGRLLYDACTGLLSAALVAGSSYLVEYSTNGRGYTLQALAFVVAFGLAVWAAQQSSRTALLLSALITALGFWAVPTMLYGLVLIAAWLGSEVHARRTALRWSDLLAGGAVVGLLSFLLYLPVVLVSGPERLVGNRFVEPLAAAELARELPASLGRTWAFWNRDLPILGSAVLVLGVVVDTARAVRCRRVPLAVLAAGVCLALVLVQRVAPFERVWLFLLPLYLLLGSGGLMWLLARCPTATARWTRGVAVTVIGLALGGLVLTSGSILASSETGTFPDAQRVANALRGRLGPEDVVVTLLPTSLPELQYAFRRVGLPAETLVRSPEAARRLFVVTPPGGDPGYPAEWSPPVVEQQFPGSTLYRLDRRPAAAMN